MLAVISNKEERPADAEPVDGAYLLFARGLPPALGAYTLTRNAARHWPRTHCHTLGRAIPLSPMSPRTHRKS